MTRAHRVLAGLLLAASLAVLAARAGTAQSRSRRADARRCARWSRPSSRPSPTTTASAPSPTPRPRSAQMFGTPERFLAMVRASYPVVYRPSAVVFLHPARVEGQLVQGVHLTDAGGALWLAVYRSSASPTQSWRISGCDVQPAPAR